MSVLLSLYAARPASCFPPPTVAHRSTIVNVQDTQERLCHNDPMTTSTYVALLRAINVGGSSVMTMADLKAQFEAVGFANVRTYIQSGNVLFEAPEESMSWLATHHRAECDSQARGGRQPTSGHPVLAPQHRVP